MTAYIYDETSGEFLRSEPCHLDPLESKLTGHDVYLLPAHSTQTAPESRDGFAAVWKGGAWVYVEDHRGSEYWPAGSTHDSYPVEMKTLGPLPDGAMTERPDYTAEEIAEQERLRAEAEAEAARVPDLEAAVAELGATTSSDKEESDAAALDLAAYAAELEQRIAKLEEKNG